MEIDPKEIECGIPIVGTRFVGRAGYQPLARTKTSTVTDWLCQAGFPKGEAASTNTPATPQITEKGGEGEGDNGKVDKDDSRRDDSGGERKSDPDGGRIASYQGALSGSASSAIGRHTSSTKLDLDQRSRGAKGSRTAASRLVADKGRN